MKACDKCSVNRVIIGKNFLSQPIWRRSIGLLLVYLPIALLPFFILCAFLIYYHLIFMGAKNVKKWKDFKPDPASHRYNLKNQITMTPNFWGSLVKSKLFWIFNCTWYCPSSVALFEWLTYMIKLIENWWCPFVHAKKDNYKDAPIDKSFWHVYPVEAAKLAPKDCANPLWNEDQAGPEKTDLENQP